jgi:hypothetical protein
MKEIIMTIVRMFVLIVCSVIQIIAALFQIVAMATGKVSELLRAGTEWLMNKFDRGRYERREKSTEIVEYE